jgi:hypothetical protein
VKRRSVVDAVWLNDDKVVFPSLATSFTPFIHSFFLSLKLMGLKREPKEIITIWILGKQVTVKLTSLLTNKYSTVSYLPSPDRFEYPFRPNRRPVVQVCFTSTERCVCLCAHVSF